MSRPRVSVLVGTSNRPGVLSRCIESVRLQSYNDLELLILDNSSELNTCERLSDDLTEDWVECVHLDESVGVAESRNRLMERATGDIFVVIDDDAYFSHKEALERVVDGFCEDIGIQAFKIVDHPSEDETRILAPISQSGSAEQNLDTCFQASYFVGGGHAIRRNVIETCGDYNEELVYGAEELDLSYRAIDAGFTIKYNPKVVVNHVPEQPIISRETIGHSELYYSVRNKLYIAYKYLPATYLPSYALVWLAYYAAVAIRTGKALSYARGMKSGLRLCQSTDRSPVDSETVQYLKENHGRLWY